MVLQRLVKMVDIEKNDPDDELGEFSDTSEEDLPFVDTNYLYSRDCIRLDGLVVKVWRYNKNCLY